MKFRFSYQKLLDHRATLEDIARRDFYEAQNRVNMAERELREMYDQVSDARRRSAQLEQSEGNPASNLAMLNEFIVGQQVRIESQRKKIRQLMSEAESLHEKLVEAAKERKTLEKLKEKRFEEFRKMMQKKELKMIDEIVTTRHRPVDLSDGRSSGEQ